MSYRPYHTFLSPIAANTYCLGNDAQHGGRGVVPAFMIFNGGVSATATTGVTFEFLGPGFDGPNNEPGSEGVTFWVSVQPNETKFLDIAIRRINSAPAGGVVTVFTQG